MVVEPSLRPRPPSAVAGRAIDVAMIAARSPRRERFLAGAAAVLWPLRTDIELTPGDDIAQAERFGATRVVLDIGRDRPGPLDPALAAAAIAAGAVIVTDDPDPPAPLVPGRHLLVAPTDHLAEQAVALALDEPRRAALAAAAAAADIVVPVPVAAPPVPDARAPSFVHRARHALARALGPDPARVLAESEHLELLLAEMKTAYLAQVDHRRALERRATRSHGDPTRTPAWASAAPVVSAVVPMHRDVAAAVTAAAAAFGRAAVAGEVVVVGQGAAETLSGVPWLPAAAVEAGRPLSPGETVALGVEPTRGEHLVVLEPGEVLHPNAIGALLGALAGQPGAVVGAYGITELTAGGSAVGVRGHLDWSVDLLVRERVFDGVALIRRDAWSRLGDTPGGALLDGWQRTDRCLAVAERGWRLVPTRSFVARRPAEHRPAWFEAIDPTWLWLALFERHPRLPWPS